MFRNIIFAVIFLTSNILLYLLVRYLADHQDLHLLYLVVRAILFTSMIMQFLFAFNIVKIPKKISEW